MIAGGGERVTLHQVAEYADASNFGAHPYTASAFTLEDVKRKYAALEQHCQALGRPYESALRSHLTFPLVLAETPAAVLAKLDRSPTDWLAFTKTSRIAGTPPEVAEQYGAHAGIGVSYFIATICEDDFDSVRLPGEQVRPLVTSR